MSLSLRKGNLGKCWPLMPLDTERKGSARPCRRTTWPTKEAQGSDVVCAWPSDSGSLAWLETRLKIEWPSGFGERPRFRLIMEDNVEAKKTGFCLLRPWQAIIDV